MSQHYSVLIVEDNEGDADYLQRAIQRAEGDFRFEATVVGWLNTAITALSARVYDVVLLDLSLPDSQGIDTVVTFTRAAPEIPVIVMTGHDDMLTGIQSVRYGAQDYIIKGDVNERMLERSVVYAIERKRADQVSKKLMRASVANVSSDNDGATAMMVSDHLTHVSDFMHDLRAYLGRNAPSHMESVEAIISKHEIDVVLREIRAILLLDGVAPSRHTPRIGTIRPGRPVRKVSDMAIAAVRRIASDTPPPATPADARETLLSVIESGQDIASRYSGADDE